MTIKALVIDDDALTRDMLRQILFQLAGFQVQSCKSYIDVKNQLKSLEFDIVFLDIELGDGNGLTLINDIKKVNSNARIVILSGHTTKKNVELAIKSGVDLFLSKPFSIENLKQALKKMNFEILET